MSPIETSLLVSVRESAFLAYTLNNVTRPIVILLAYPDSAAAPTYAALCHRMSRLMSLFPIIYATIDPSKQDQWVVPPRVPSPEDVISQNGMRRMVRPKTYWSTHFIAPRPLLDSPDQTCASSFSPPLHPYSLYVYLAVTANPIVTDGAGL